jgi:hypothetical protein
MRPQPVVRDDSVMEDWLLLDSINRQNALGEIVLESAYLERLLRCVFTALIGSKYAAVVSGGQNAGWLVDHCKALAKVHQEIAEPERGQLLAHLGLCGGAYQRRNRVVHDAHAVRRGERIVTLRSKPQSHDVVVTAAPVAELKVLADELQAAADGLSAAARAAFGDDCLELENRLRLELGHDITADIG